MNFGAANKAWIAALGPILLTIFLKIDANYLAGINWSMGSEFWAAVSTGIVGYLAWRVPNIVKPNPVDNAKSGDAS